MHAGMPNARILYFSNNPRTILFLRRKRKPILFLRKEREDILTLRSNLKTYRGINSEPNTNIKLIFKLSTKAVMNIILKQQT